MGLLAAISNGLKALASVFGWAQQRDGEENSPEMQENAAAATRQKIAEQAAKDALAATNANLDKIRQDASEN